MTDGSSHNPPVDEGEIMFADAERGMLTTKGGLALSFTREQCRGFEPVARNVVSIARIEGMQAFGLSLLADAPAPMFSIPPVDKKQVEELAEKAQLEPRSAPLSTHALREQLAPVDWEAVFTEIDRKEPGLSPEVLVKALAEIQRPFDRLEIEQILQFEPSVESLVNPLMGIGGRWPRSWLRLLSWSDGGEFSTGERNFSDMFSVAEVREFTTLYGIVQYLPGAVPFSMDGGAALYLFDTRTSTADGEFPVVFCHSSEVADGWDAVVRLEDTFLACCRSSTDPEDLR